MIEDNRERNMIEDAGLTEAIVAPNAMPMLQENGNLHSHEPQSTLFASLENDETTLNNQYLVMVARRVQPRWRQLALILGFNDNDCEDFENGDNSFGPWWPCFRMLDTFRAQLSETEARNAKEILADAIRRLDPLISALSY